MTLSETEHSQYGKTSWFYQQASHIYSGGQIRASKKWQLQWLKPQQHILYVGAGQGEDVIMAAKAQLRVTVIELSPQMLNGLRKRLKKENLEARVTLICGDAFKHEPSSLYDAVAANYFLNVFSEKTMQSMVAKLLSFVKPAGLLLIADFAPASPKPVTRVFQKVYYFAALLAFHFIANNPVHPLYDYEDLLSHRKLECLAKQKFPLFGFGPKWYQALALIKTE